MIYLYAISDIKLT